ncbi:MAG: universal stress protein [Catalinimonas sp.]
MKPFRHVLVGLDGSGLDAVLLRYLARLLAYLPIRRVVLFRAYAAADLPKGLRHDYPELFEDPATDYLHQLAERYLSDVPWAAENFHGAFTDGMLTALRKHETDLLVMGAKTGPRGRGTRARQVIRMAPCSVLIVPEAPPRELREVLVPVDFSPYARAALEVATRLCPTGGAKLYWQHVYTVPTGWSHTGKSYQTFARIMHDHAARESEAFAADLSLPDDTHLLLTLDNDRDPADKIYEEAVRRGVDLIVIGAQGQTRAAARLLGSVAERLAYHDRPLPLLIVRPAGENENLLDALLNRFG